MTQQQNEAVAVTQALWRINPETPTTIMTPHGRISIGWSVNGDYTLAEETAAMIVEAVNTRLASQSRSSDIEAEREQGPPCENCLKPVEVGQVVLPWDDAGEMHANCERPFSLGLRLAFNTLIFAGVPDEALQAKDHSHVG